MLISKIFKFTGNFWKENPKNLILSLILITTAGFLESSLPYFLSNIIQTVKTSPENIWKEFLLFCGLLLFIQILFITSYIIYNHFEVKIFSNILKKTFFHILSLSENFFSSTQTGTLLSKIKRGRDKIEELQDQVFINLFPALAISIGTTIYLSLNFPYISILFVLFIIITAISTYFIITKISGPSQEIFITEQDKFLAHTSDTLSSISTVKSFGRESFEKENYKTVINKLEHANLRANLKTNLAYLFQKINLSFLLILMIGSGLYLFSLEKITLENLAGLILSYSLVNSYLEKLNNNIKKILTCCYDLDSVIELLQEKSDLTNPEKPKDFKAKTINIKFKNISFSYPNNTKQSLQNISFSVQEGERVALIGMSGSGKTTLLKLLQRLYDPTNGSITINEHCLKTINQKDLKNCIAVVSQDPVLFHRSFLENIRYGNPNATEEEINDVIEKAYLTETLKKLKDGYNTLVGEKGVKLSGGEKQRVAIARALLSNKPLLLLDEATSALDSESEEAIQKALLALTHKQTSLIIAHRLSTIIDADKIVVLDEGKILEIGSPRELWDKKEYFYRLCKKQGITLFE